MQLDYEDLVVPEHLIGPSFSEETILHTLILFPKANGNYVPYILKIYPDDAERKFRLADFLAGGYQKIPADFSGKYLFYKWNEKLIGGWRIKDGEKVKRIKPSKKEKQKKNQENSKITGDVVCYEITHTEYQITCQRGFGCSDPEVIGVYYTYECEYTSSPPPPVLVGEGWGGGGGTTPPEDDPCEVPDENIIGLRVDCEEEIDLTKLSNCHKLLINQLIGSSRDDFRIIFNKFSGSLPPPINFDVNFFYGDCPNLAAGCTSPVLINNEARITLNKSIIQNSTDLSIGRTVLHEMLHAYFLFIEDFPLANQDLNTLLNLYISKYNIPGNINYNPIHHNLFVENMFLNNIAVELKHFAESLGYPSSILNDNQFFLDMAWAGLTDTDVYKNLSEVDKTRISKTYYSEINGGYKGIPPIGNLACN